MDNPNWLKYWRISATSTLTNQNFYTLGLPPINLSTYLYYAQLLPRSQGGQAAQGYKNITLLWDEMSYVQYRTLRSIVDTAITNGSIYLTLDRADGTRLLNDFVDCHGIPRPLTFTPISNGRGVVMQNVTLVVTNITIDTVPSAVL